MENGRKPDRSGHDLPPGDWRLRVYGRGPSNGATPRRSPRAADRQHVVALQGYRCLYCEIPLGTAIGRRSRTVILRAVWDHFVPYAYLARNPASNWVLACHVCNGIKSCRMFDTVQAAREAILTTRLAKGYESPQAVLHRMGLAPRESPWPVDVRAATGITYHMAREAREGWYLTACGREIAREDLRPIKADHQQCAQCLLNRNLATPAAKPPAPVATFWTLLPSRVSHKPVSKRSDLKLPAREKARGSKDRDADGEGADGGHVAAVAAQAATEPDRPNQPRRKRRPATDEATRSSRYAIEHALTAYGYSSRAARALIESLIDEEIMQ